MKYADKLKDPRWQQKRLEIFERDKFTCKCCQAKDRTLHVHHLYYKNNTEPWDYPSEALDTLCEYCHSYLEGKNIKAPPEPKKQTLEDFHNAFKEPI